MRSERGYTLIEILITLGLLGVISGIAPLPVVANLPLDGASGQSLDQEALEEKEDDNDRNRTEDCGGAE